MYGSQTGNAQSIAEGLHEGCKGKGIESSLLKCDAWKKARNRCIGCCSFGCFQNSKRRRLERLEYRDDLLSTFSADQSTPLLLIPLGMRYIAAVLPLYLMYRSPSVVCGRTLEGPRVCTS